MLPTVGARGVRGRSHPQARRRRRGGYLKVGLQLSGLSAVSQGRRASTVQPGQLTVYDTSRPYRLAAGPLFRAHTMLFSPQALQLSATELDRLWLRPIDCRAGLGAVLVRYLNGLRELDTRTP
ncbi:hypothetical protein [Mycobacterium sherrisii]|uniref:AraC-like ligand-binding domain-containing protein n=1 Tax=Mycobacterium sherrisii TaxID=243061 RepID=UPI000A146E63|nr:hypothetical protein [Mycobacterium sherrisii]MCV7030378.1 hypothetical protein [Mycobacterium sherrisii]MEC4763851.1 hypothetical protein [Mycobacterium sherrisii]